MEIWACWNRFKVSIFCMLSCIFFVLKSLLSESEFRSKAMEIVLDRSHASDWAYRGEGAANLVLAYSGSSSHFVCISFPVDLFFRFLVVRHVSIGNPSFLFLACV